ncbi:MAG TPA: prepilin-type N-terminal cleavage/methylation domain-containing protein [Thermoanaerobaculia bacterium]
MTNIPMRRTDHGHLRRAQGGYNLIEVLIAMAILGTVLLSIATLFVFGRRNVYSGKQLTRATSVGTHVSEDLQPLSMSQVLDYFSITASETLASNTVAGRAYPGSFIRSTADLSKDKVGGPLYLTRWKGLLPQSRMQDGKVTLVFTPRNMATANNATTAAVMQIRIITQWDESARERNVAVDVVKFNRSF